MYKTGPKFNDVSLLLSEHTLQLINFTEFFWDIFHFLRVNIFILMENIQKNFVKLIDLFDLPKK